MYNQQKSAWQALSISTLYLTVRLRVRQYYTAKLSTVLILRQRGNVKKTTIGNYLHNNFGNRSR